MGNTSSSSSSSLSSPSSSSSSPRQGRHRSGSTLSAHRGRLLSGGGHGPEGGSDGPTADFLGLLPVEIAAKVAGFLEESDVKRVRLVCRSWRAVADSELVWKHMCNIKWPALRRPPAKVGGWKGAHRVVWLGARVANRDGAREGFAYLAAHGILPSALPVELEAELLDTCPVLEPATVGRRLSDSVAEDDPGEEMRSALMDAFMRRQRCAGMFLPEAMRRLFAKARFPGHSSMSIAPVLRSFVAHYVRENPNGAPGTEEGPRREGEEERLNIHTLCYAIILLSVDLWNDNVKVKMSRREFIRNNAFMRYPDEFLMRVYDDIFLWGHIAEPKRTKPRNELWRRNIERLLS